MNIHTVVARSGRLWRTIWLMMFAACLSFLAQADAQDQKPPASAPADATATRAYEISRFLALPEFSHLVSGNPLAPNALPEFKSRDQLIADLIKEIKNQIDPSSWDDRGGRGSIQRKEDQLLITQTSGNHDALLRLLEEHGTQITVETLFITGLDIDNAKWINRGDVEVSPDFLNDSQVNAILKLTQTNNNTTILTAPRLAMFDGQRSFVTVSTDTPYVSDIKPQPDGSLDPVVSQAQSGIHFDCTTDVKPHGDSVSLRLHPTLSRLLKTYSSPWPAPPATQQATVQVPVFAKAEFDQTFEIPSGKTLVVRLNQKITPLDPNILPQPPILILVHPTIVTPREQHP